MGDQATILVADDDEILLKGLEINFRREGYRVIVARDGTGALNLATRHRPQLIVLDVVMPGVDGLQVCRQIRAWDARVPILMLSAKSEPEDRKAATRAGANAYVSKPFNLAGLLSTVREMVENGGVRSW